MMNDKMKAFPPPGSLLRFQSQAQELLLAAPTASLPGPAEHVLFAYFFSVHG